MLFGKELEGALEIFPEYAEDIREKSETERLIALSDIYRIYVPSQMGKEIYSKIYLSTVRSLKKKQTREAVQQYNENYKAMNGEDYSGIIGGSDSYSITGISGTGKSTSINRAISLMSSNQIIEVKDPYQKIITCLVVQCPFDASVKGTLMEILRLVDVKLGTNYYKDALRSHATIDGLIGSVSNIAMTHIGTIIIDEIQHVVNNKGGKNLIFCLTQLINNSGVSICMVGTPECEDFFSQAMQMARRSIGLRYGELKYGEEFIDFCKAIWRYQYVKKQSVLNDAIIRWLYEHSNGNKSIVVCLIHDAQELAILNGKEVLDLDSLSDAYKNRMSLLFDYIAPKRRKQTSSKKAAVLKLSENTFDDKAQSVTEIVEYAKNTGKEIVSCLKSVLTVEEVKV